MIFEKMNKLKKKYVVCGNKLDQTAIPRKVEKNDEYYFEISSKSSKNYDKIFEKLVKNK